MWESLKKPILYLLIASGVWTSLSAPIYCFKLQLTSWMVLLWLIMLIYFVIYLTSQVYFVLRNSHLLLHNDSNNFERGASNVFLLDLDHVKDSFFFLFHRR